MRRLVRTAVAAAAFVAVAPAVGAAVQPDSAQQSDPGAAQPAATGTPATAEIAPSADAMQVMTWVASKGDNNGAPYIVVDKVAAAVFLFDSGGQLLASAPALVGMAAGDTSGAFAGDRELSTIPPDERTTPAGRFFAKFGPAEGHRDVLWVDYPSAISLHAVITVRKQHRLERLKTADPDDNRITYGCINVPTAFYKTFVKPLFEKSGGVVYILPEEKPLRAVFPAIPPEVASAPQ